MSVVAEVAVPTSSVAMADTLAAAPETVVEIERVVAHPNGKLTPYFWVYGDLDAFESAVAEDPTVDEATRLDTHESEALYRAEWPGGVESVANAVVETGGTLVSATGQRGGWDLRIRFENPGQLPSFSTYCERHDVTYEVKRVFRSGDAGAPDRFGVTEKQREALVAALDAGFYEVPPEATMSEVADELGISQQALSKRLRRGHGNLVGDVFEEPGADGAPDGEQ
ncbi:bacterio-opsin activator domain-containing protein [Halobacterium sp. CBA1126]|uniref:helix-turn-helix domain-containing protein n=1 Tax=Halobacterium TaxID=2239 RepID=UPI0012F87C12|nr:bacterio-opsin activator domain-containing protein [Halobacterium sp. CBA1126]MUV60503.1 bacterio-opsin activator [Halobacterium sp. CBA1126]